MIDTPRDGSSKGSVIESPAPLWRPSQHRIERSALTAFCAVVNKRFPKVEVSTYEALHHWSITATDDFWGCIWD